MTESIKIEIISEEELKPQPRILPLVDTTINLCFYTSGKLYGGVSMPFIKQHVLKEIREHANADTHNECGGVLVGNYYIHEGIPFLLIEGYIRAKGASSPGSFRFTVEALQEIDKIRQAKFPKHLTIGWCHSHPGYGIFLSVPDKDIQRNIFNKPYHIAFVIDPVKKQEGCYVWKENQLIGPTGFIVLCTESKESTRG